MGDINTNIRIDRLQKVVKEIAGRGTVRTKVTTFYPESSGSAFDFTPDENTIMTVWSTHMSSPTQNYAGLTVGKLNLDVIAPNNYGLIGSNAAFTCFDGQITFYFAAPGGFEIMEIILDSED